MTRKILGDRPYMETQSRRFHKLDLNSDGRVTRNEFETYFRNQDRDDEDAHHHRRLHADNFFKQIVGFAFNKTKTTQKKWFKLF